MFKHGLLASCEHCRGMENIFVFSEAIKSGNYGYIRNVIGKEWRFFLKNNHTLPVCFTKDEIEPDTLKIMNDLGIKFAPNAQYGDYKRMLEEGHNKLQGQAHHSRLEFIADHVFNFTTYECEYSELFAKKAIEVCDAINDGKTYEYIKEHENRLWYSLMVNMPFFSDKLEWGASIRGAWWSEGPHKFSSCGLFLDGEQLCETMEFTREQWREFVVAVVEFGRA